MKPSKRARPTLISSDEGHQNAGLPTVTPQLLPCRIHYDGPAPISAFFHEHPAATPPGSASLSQATHLSSSFRGRELFGASLPLPRRTVGLVLEENAREAAEYSDDTENDFSASELELGSDSFAEGDDGEREAGVPDAKRMRIAATFDGIKVWQRELPVSSHALPCQWLYEWVPLSQAIHAPVSLAQLEAVDLTKLTVLD